MYGPSLPPTGAHKQPADAEDKDLGGGRAGAGSGPNSNGRTSPSPHQGPAFGFNYGSTAGEVGVWTGDIERWDEETSKMLGAADTRSDARCGTPWS